MNGLELRPIDPEKTIRCWQCGLAPLSQYDVTGLGDKTQRFIPGRWPASDGHEHAEQPPTPSDLEKAGHEALMRIYAQR